MAALPVAYGSEDDSDDYDGPPLLDVNSKEGNDRDVEVEEGKKPVATFDGALGGHLGARINNLKLLKLIDNLGP